jgi:DNA polymerase alpha subunit A
MASLLGALDKAPAPSKPSLKRKTSPPMTSDRGSSPDRAYPNLHLEEDYLTSPKKRPRTTGSSSSGMTPTIDRMADMAFNTDSDGADVDYDSFFEDDIDMDVDENGDFKVKPEPEEIVLPKQKARPAPAPAPKEEKDEDIKPRWLSIHEALNVAKEDETIGTLPSSSASKSINIDALESDGALRFFWLDYLEHNGRLYLIGKLKDKKTNLWISCCVTVENLQRNLFALPRERRVEMDEDGDEVETDVIPDEEDVYNDFDLIRQEMKIKTFKGKFVERSYAFGDKDIPRGSAKWLKIVYPFTGMEVLPLPPS